MKNLLEYKKESVKVSEPSKAWEKIYLEISEKLSEWNVLDSDIDLLGFDCPDLSMFEPNFIQYLIKKSLNIPDNVLWSDIFKIGRSRVEQKSYHGSDSNILIETWEFDVDDKRNRLKKVPGPWLYDNFQLVSEFMDIKNELYMKLIEIKRLFPIQVEV